MATLVDGSTNWEGTIAVSKQSGTKVTLDTDKKYIAKDIELTINVQGGAYSADSSSSSNSTVTPSVALDNSATSTYGFTTTKPSSGTSGTNYLTIDPNASATAWSVAPRASVTTAGFISTGSKTGSVVSNTPSISAGTNYYQPVVSASFSGGGLTNTNYAKTDLAVTLASGSDTNMTNASVGAKNTSTYPYYFKVSASTPAVSGTTKVSRAAVTYTNSAGAIAAHNAATALSAGESSPTVSVNATSNATYVNIKSATISPTVSNSGISTYFNSGTSSDKDVTITPQYTNTAGFAPEHSSAQAGTAAYYKIKTASPAFDGGDLSGGSTATGTNVTLSSTDNGIKIQTAYTASRGAVLYNGAINGWVSKSDNATALSSASKGSTNGNVYYVTGVTVPKDKGFSIVTSADTALDTTSDLDVNNAAYRRVDVVNNANGTVLVSNSGSSTITSGSKTAGTTVINAYDTSSASSTTSKTIVSNGVWSTTAANGSGTYYGRITVAGGSATTPSTSITANPTITMSDTGLITASYSGSKSIAPTVSSGWISSGTSGTVSTSGSSTYQIPVATIAETKAYLGIA